MNCLAFEALLDEGAPDRLPEAALAHVRDCAACARSLARSRTLEAALERHFTSSSSASESAALVGFADRVLARVERTEARSVRWLTLPDALPWWVRATAEPSALLAGVVASLLLWRGPVLLAAARTWLAPGGIDSSPFVTLAHDWGLDAAARAFWTALVPATGPDWAVVTGVTLGVAPLLALIAWAMWRAGERLADAGPLHSLR